MGFIREGFVMYFPYGLSYSGGVLPFRPFRSIAVGDLVCTGRSPRVGSGTVVGVWGSTVTVEFRDGERHTFEREDVLRERSCSLPGCGKMNTVGERICWACGADLVP